MAATCGSAIVKILELLVRLYIAAVIVCGLIVTAPLWGALLVLDALSNPRRILLTITRPQRRGTDERRLSNEGN